MVHRKTITATLLLPIAIAGCLLPLTLLCSAGNVGAYYLLRNPVTIRDPARINVEMDRIGDSVRALRGITDAKTVDRALITPEDLRKQMTEEFRKNYSPEAAHDDLEEYVAFGILDPQTDLYQLWLDAYSTGTLGYYDPSTKKLYVVSGSGLGPSERSTYAHEYMHALQDQRYDLNKLNSNEGAVAEDSERSAAIQALTEGEAELVMEVWQQRAFSFSDTLDYYKQAFSMLDATIFQIPAFLQEEVYFPYRQGKDFVAGLYEKGGWSAVDSAYRKPPLNTEMILHPDKYSTYDLPKSVEKPILPEELPGSWRELNDNAMGEFSILLILETHALPEDAAQAAAGWGSDRYIIWHDEAAGKTILTWHTQWDSPADADEFKNTLSTYNSKRFGDAVFTNHHPCWSQTVVVCMEQTGPKDVWWFYGPDSQTVQYLMNANLPKPIPAME